MSHFQTEIMKFREAVPGNQELALKFLSSQVKGSRYLIGKNQQSEDIHALCKVDGILDDYCAPGSFWKDIPLVKGSDIMEGSFVVNCATSISPVSVRNKFKTSALNYLDFFEVKHAAAEKIPKPWFVHQMETDLDNYTKEWELIYDRLADINSKEILLNVLAFRLTADPSYMTSYSVRLQDQYFEDFLQLKEEVFVDAGGFDGDTTEVFCRRYPDYKKVYFFEPSKVNMQKARQRLDGFHDIEYFSIGLSNKKDTLYFDPNAGSASSIMTDNSKEEVNTIQVDQLDVLVHDPVSLIKMDLEGWELFALQGCEKHIVHDKPKLTIAVYHDAKDFREVFAYALSLHSDYKVYLRHYTEGWSETVMSFVPPAK